MRHPVYWLISILLFISNPQVSGQIQKSDPAQQSQPLTLSEAIRRARQQHPLIIAAHQRILAAEGLQLEAGLRPNPTVTVSGENFPLQRPEQGFDAGRTIDWFATFSNTIETGGKRQLRLSVAERSVEMAQAEVAAIERQIVYEVKTAWERAILESRRIELASEAVTHLQQLAQLNQIRVEAGYIAAGDLIKTRLEAQRADYVLQQNTLAYTRAKIELLRAMGSSSFEPDYELAEHLDFHPVAINRETLQEAALRRPEVKVSETRLTHAEAVLRLENARARPDVTTTFGYKRNGPDNALYGAVSVPLPLYSRNRGQIARAQADVKAAAAELQHVRNTVLAELTAARRAVEAYQRQVEKLQADFLRQADESQAVSLAAYREGATSLLTLIEAQRARTQAQELYYEAIHNYRLAVHELERAAGIEQLPLQVVMQRAAERQD